MIDDEDLDIDLELGSDPEPPRRRKRAKAAKDGEQGGAEESGNDEDEKAPAGATSQGKQPSAGQKQAPTEESSEEEGSEGDGVAVVGSERQSLLNRIMSPIAELIGRIPVPRFNLKSFLIGLGILILLIAIVNNWAPTRLSFIGLHADVPSAVVIAAAFAVGFFTAWFILRRRRSQHAA